MQDEGDRSAGRDTDRIQAFSDGVLAIAITLLILDVRVPEHSGSLAHGLRLALPNLVAFAASFLIIGIIWANHHTLFKLIERSDPVLVLFNLLLLGAVSFLPFPTALVAEYAGHPADERTALLLYAGTLTAMALGFNGVWRYALAKGLTVAGLDNAFLRSVHRRYLAGPFLYVASGALAFVNPWLTLAITVGLALLFLLGPSRKPALAEPVPSPGEPPA